MRIFASLALLLMPLLVFSQEQQTQTEPVYDHSVSLFASFPLGEFSETHSPGISARYMRQVAAGRRNNARSPRKPGWIYGGGLGLNKGKKVELNDFGYRYRDYLVAFLAGGVNYFFTKNSEAGISLGPSLTRYRDVYRFNLYAGLFTTYHFDGNFGATAGLDILKENKAAWMAMIKAGATYRF